MTTDNKRAADIEAIMEQAQVFASAWSLVGGVFDDGNMLETSGDEKQTLREMIEAALSARADSDFKTNDQKQAKQDLLDYLDSNHGLKFERADSGSDARDAALEEAANKLEKEYLKVANGEIKMAKMSLKPLVSAVQAMRAAIAKGDSK